MATRPYGIEIALGSSVTQLTLTGIGANEALLVSSATVLNKNATTQLLTMNLASGGAVAADGNLIEYQKTLSAKAATNTSLSGKTIMPGAKLYAGSDTATGITLQISGTVISQAA